MPATQSELERAKRLRPTLPAPRPRVLPGVPSLRSVAVASVLVAASAALIVVYAALAPGPDTTSTRSTASTAPAPEPAPRPAPRSTGGAGAAPLPAFVWVPARGATAYEFRLLRGDEPVYTARTTTPRLALPRSWTVGGRVRRLEPGSYVWDVRPVVGGRLGDVLVRARLTVS